MFGGNYLLLNYLLSFFADFCSYKQVVTSKWAATAVFVCWLLSIIAGLTPMFGWNNLKALKLGDSLGPSLNITCDFERVISMEYMVYLNFFGWVLPPLVTMLIIYTEIFYMIHKQLSKKVSGNQADPRRYYGKELKLVKSLALFLFAVSWLLLHILNCVTLLCPELKNKILIYITILLSHGNSAVHPLVYTYRIKKFRRAFINIWEQYFYCREVTLPFSQAIRKMKIVEKRLARNTLTNQLIY